VQSVINASADGDTVTVPAGNWGGSGWTFWQDSGTGVVPGISGQVDLDRYGGSSLAPALLVP